MQIDSSHVARELRIPEPAEVSTVLLDLAPDGILAVDESGRVASVNATAGRLLGYSVADADGLTLTDVLKPSVRGDGMAWLRDIHVKGGFTDVGALRADGSLGCFQLAVRAVQIHGRLLFAVYLREARDRRRVRPDAAGSGQTERRLSAHDRRQTRQNPAREPIVYVVIGESSLRASLAATLQRCGWKVKKFSVARSFLSHAHALVPGCVVLDMELPDFDGLALQSRMSSRYAALPIIFVTRHGDVATSVRAMKAGAFEFFAQPLPENAILAAVQDATVFSRSILDRAAVLHSLQTRYVSLTPRERDVMKGVVAGLLNKQVASELGISEITVKAHRGRVMRKMQAHSVAELVRFSALVSLGQSRIRG